MITTVDADFLALPLEKVADAALSAATGKEFDVLWLKGMTEHHDGAIHMTQMIEDAQNAEIKAFGSKVIKDQSEQIDQMKKILARLS